MRSSCAIHAARSSQRQRGQYVIWTRDTWRVLRLDLHRRAVRDGAPDLLDLLIGERNAAVRPIVQAMILAHVAVLLGQSVDHDLAAGIEAQALRARTMLRIRIG